MPSKLVILYLNPHQAGLASLHRGGGGGPRRWVKYIIYIKTFYVNIFRVFNGFLYLLKSYIDSGQITHRTEWISAPVHMVRIFFFVRRSESLCRSFVTRSESLCRSFVTRSESLSSLMTRSESLSHHSWRGVNLCAVIHDAEWISTPGSMAQKRNSTSFRIQDAEWISAPDFIDRNRRNIRTFSLVYEKKYNIIFPSKSGWFREKISDQKIPRYSPFKGTVARDFFDLGFFHGCTLYWP
jgi:hypothetical protein